MSAPQLNCDVLVIGGGAAGIAAATAAGRTGAKTILLERYGFLGGLATTTPPGPPTAAVAVFARLPARGAVKTRLAAGVGEEAAAELYAACAQRAVAQASRQGGVGARAAWPPAPGCARQTVHPLTPNAAPPASLAVSAWWRSPQSPRGPPWAPGWPKRAWYAGGRGRAGRWAAAAVCAGGGRPRRPWLPPNLFRPPTVWSHRRRPRTWAPA